jgi:alpha-ketoglutaric semialdehyde dehydrogenase
MTQSSLISAEICNFIDGEERPAQAGEWVEKYNPASGELLCRLARSRAADIHVAVASAKAAQPAWARTPGVKRGEVLHAIADVMRARRERLAQIVGIETGKSYKQALGETDGAIQLARFYASEGQRLYGRTTTSGTPDRSAMTLRCPIGVAGLVMASNTPIANVAWKVFPALVCGNAAVVKPPEDAPAIALEVARCARESDLAPGLLQVVQGLGDEAGAALVEHGDVGVVSFTGSTRVGRQIAVAVGKRMGRVSLELGGKNAFVVCDDADLAVAERWALLSAFSNAGQRCAAGSRIIVFQSVYEEFRDRFVAAAKRQKVGVGDDDDFGPLISARQLSAVLACIERGVARGARVLMGGQRLTGGPWRGGYYLAPTVIENADTRDELSTYELFAPVTCLYRARDFEDAVCLANDSPYGLTACIHTKSIHRAWQFVQAAHTGVVFVNAGTYGSEPHMPFGGMKQSGNGTREPGTEALDVYSSLKDVYLSIDPTHL